MQYHILDCLWFQEINRKCLSFPNHKNLMFLHIIIHIFADMIEYVIFQYSIKLLLDIPTKHEKNIYHFHTILKCAMILFT